MIKVKSDDVILDVTDMDDFWADVSLIDGGIIPVQKCSCGKNFSLGDFNVYDNDLSNVEFMVNQCPHCKQSFMAVVNVTVYRVING